MEMYESYDLELSLFAGDVLPVAGMTAPSGQPAHAVTKQDSGRQHARLTLNVDVASSYQQGGPSPDVLSPQALHDNDVSPLAGWMDTKVDLLEYLTGEEIAPDPASSPELDKEVALPFQYLQVEEVQPDAATGSAVQIPVATSSPVAAFPHGSPVASLELAPYASPMQYTTAMSPVVSAYHSAVSSPVCEMQALFGNMAALQPVSSGVAEEVNPVSLLSSLAMELLTSTQQQDQDYAGNPVVVLEGNPDVLAHELLQDVSESNRESLLEQHPEDEMDIATDLDLLRLLTGTVEEPTGSRQYTQASMLSPMTIEEVDSILSSGPSSPDTSLSSINQDNSSMEYSSNNTSSTGSEMGMDLAQFLSQVQTQPELSVNLNPSIESDDSCFFDGDDSEDYVPHTRVSKSSSRRITPYERPGRKTPVDPKDRELERKLRKKQQNKDAATRYRQKKKAETHVIDSEYNQLENRNTELKDTVDQMTREIRYLKNLLSEVYTAKGRMKPAQKSK